MKKLVPMELCQGTRWGPLNDKLRSGVAAVRGLSEDEDSILQR